MTESSRSSRTDGEATRSRILETAGKLFSRTGFAETTSKAIAVEAEVDLASINYHFGSRVGLYQAVLAEAHRRIINVDDLLRISERDVPAEEKLRDFFAILVDAAQSGGGWHSGVLARELLSPTSNLQVLFTEELQPKLVILLGILSEITGIATQDPALLRCLISTAAPCLMLVVASNGIPGPAQTVLQLPKEELVTHLYTFTLAGLKAISRQ
ncbi:CerR family C-terminal domain-containing protein [Pseudomonas extremaustralis]|uniref:TetR/AcrR family transcriptional regulator n=1 Tax=Pseudomonas extremaustralis TaxID=359110 RepID=UPI0021CA90E7|nr:CerR family C-terminal domain-containing protein [Pseudomonas extremaustralis]UUJ40875.1 CerR family C-terminal domain-containing protein [Pseudomonas extremaustralis]